MKSLILVLSLLISSLATSQEVTVYLIRHAQAQDDGTKNPQLSEIGKLQAKQWEVIFKDIHLDHIYSTDYNRTQETAAPTARSKDLEVKSYDPNSFDITQLVERSDGKTLLIVGHSNTTPDNVNVLLGTKTYEWIDHHKHGYQFIVKVSGESVVVKKKKLFNDHLKTE
jgi:broad specificity phosphatase PhoE